MEFHEGIKCCAPVLQQYPRHQRLAQRTTDKDGGAEVKGNNAYQHVLEPSHLKCNRVRWSTDDPVELEYSLLTRLRFPSPNDAFVRRRPCKIEPGSLVISEPFGNCMKLVDVQLQYALHEQCRQPRYWRKLSKGRDANEPA